MMKSLASRLPETTVLAVLIATVLLPSSCKDLGEEAVPAPVQVITVALRNTDTYQYPTVGGDEEGALIVRQAQHYRVSEVRRDAGTNWVCVYVYQPQVGYLGSDYTELEIHTNKVGTPEHTQVSRLGFSFTISN